MLKYNQAKEYIRNLYFLVNLDLPVFYHVKRLFDGRSFATRYVECRQEKKIMLSALIAYHKVSDSNRSSKSFIRPKCSTKKILPLIELDVDVTELGSGLKIYYLFSPRSTLSSINRRCRQYRTPRIVRNSTQSLPIIRVPLSQSSQNFLIVLIYNQVIYSARLPLGSRTHYDQTNSNETKLVFSPYDVSRSSDLFFKCKLPISVPLYGSPTILHDEKRNR